MIQNNGQYFWINKRDLEIETKHNWQVIFDKYKDLSTQKYRIKNNICKIIKYL